MTTSGPCTQEAALGNQCNWVRNVRAAGGVATIRHGRARACHLVEVPVEERGPILKRYLQKVPGARPHVPVDRNAPLAEGDCEGKEVICPWHGARFDLGTGAALCAPAARGVKAYPVQVVGDEVQVDI